MVHGPAVSESSGSLLEIQNPMPYPSMLNQTLQFIPLIYLLLRENSTWGACGKLAHLFSQRHGISSHLGTNRVHGTFFELLCWNEYSYRLEAGVLENLFSVLKEVKPLLLYSVEHGIAMEPMKGKRASSGVDLGYTDLFCIPEVHQCSSHFVTVFLGTLCCSIKKIEVP